MPIMSVFQSWSQGVAVFGREGMLTLFSAINAFLRLSGVRENDFLQNLTEIIGDYDRGTTTVSLNRGVRSTSTNSPRSPAAAPSSSPPAPASHSCAPSSGTEAQKTTATRINASISIHDPEPGRPRKRFRPKARSGLLSWKPDTTQHRMSDEDDDAFGPDSSPPPATPVGRCSRSQHLLRLRRRVVPPLLALHAPVAGPPAGGTTTEPPIASKPSGEPGKPAAKTRPGMSTWWLNHSDPHMNALLAPDGPFAALSDKNQPGELLPYQQGPTGRFPPDRHFD